MLFLPSLHRSGEGIRVRSSQQARVDFVQGRLYGLQSPGGMNISPQLVGHVPKHYILPFWVCKPRLT